MSTSAEPHTNGNGHDHILRPRPGKPANPDVLRTLGEEGLTVQGHSKDYLEAGSGQTRYANKPTSILLEAHSVAVVVQLPYQKMRLLPRNTSTLPEDSSKLRVDVCFHPSTMNLESHTLVLAASTETLQGFMCFSG